MANIKTPDDILKDLESISPLALPGYLHECEYFDRTDAFDQLEKAIAQFEGEGGVAKSIVNSTLEAVVNSVGLVLLRKFNEPLYKKAVKTKTTNFSEYAKKALTFSLADYDLETKELYSPQALKQDLLKRGMVRHPGVPDENGHFDPLFNVGKYDRKKDFELQVKDADGTIKGRSVQYVEEQSLDGKTVRGVGGEVLSVDNKAEPDKTKRAQGDHVTPLKMIHEQSGYFIERYVDVDSTDEKGRTVLQKIVNDDSNFQVLSADMNASKGGGLTNIAYIEQCSKMAKAAELYKKMETATGADRQAIQEQISELGLSPTKRKAARKMANKDNLSEEEKKDLKKYELTDEQKKELEENQKKSEAKLRNALLIEGAKTVGYEQIGRLIEVLIGPISFEIRDAISNGITHGFDGYDSFEAFCKRLWRALRYVFKQLGRLLGDALGDLGKMLATFFANACKVLKDFFGKFFDLALSGISVLVDSVKVLMGEGSAAQKGEAILKIVVGFATGILSQTLIDSALESLGLPDPFSDIFAAIFSALISTLVMAGFDRLDLFGLKREMLRNRINEIFDAREAQLVEASQAFDMATLQVLKKNRMALESIRINLQAGVELKDFYSINVALDEACELFQIEIPYHNAQEFVNLIRSKHRIQIA